MVGIVIVSHSATLAEGAAELARQMGGDDVAIETAGGMDDGSIGTDAERVMAAIERVRTEDGVLVLMDLGSALMSAEIAVEMLGDGGPVRLSGAPLVEGAVAAAARARTGAALDEVAGEAGGALAMKTSQLGESEPEAAAPPAAGGGEGLRLLLQVGNRLGLHLRPAGEVVGAVAKLDARVRISNGTRGPVDARSLTGLAMLQAHQGDELEVEAEGPDAQAALDALRALAEDNFGDPPDAEVAAGDSAGATGMAASGVGAAGAAAGSEGAGAAGAAAGGEGAEATGTAASDAGAAGAAAGGEGAEATGTAASDAGAAGAAAGDGAGGAAAAGEGARGAAAAGDGARPADADVAAGDRRTLRGARVAGGVVVGPARLLAAAEPEIDDTPAGPPEREQARLDAARAVVRDELVALGKRSEIFAAHALLLDDAALLDPVGERIAGGAAAPRAWADSAAELAASFRGLDDAYLQARAVDVEDVRRRVLVELAGAPDATGPTAPGIVVADELTPGQVAVLDPETVWAIAAARGGVTDHASIVAGGLGIPVVVGVGPALLSIPEGSAIAVDGDAGTVERDPDEAVVAAAEARRAEAAQQLARAAEPVTLADGTHIGVHANIGSPADARLAVAQGAEGVGLLRTEFLFLDRAQAPSEDEQVEVLTQIAQALDGRPLIVRTLDAGADKPLPFVRQAPEANPFLGVRGIRLTLAEPELFDTQLRAIVRVAAEYPLKVMFPMVATVKELLAARERLDALRGATELEVGVMVEVPALAIQAADFAPHVDFFSIGTNDLAQYTMAAERGNPALAGLLEDALKPLLALVTAVTAAAAAHGVRVGVCGELAGNPQAAPLLVAAGVRELSMAPGRIPALKAALRGAELAATR